MFDLFTQRLYRLFENLFQLFHSVKSDTMMSTYTNDRNIKKKCDNIEVNVEKLQNFGPCSKTLPSRTPMLVSLGSQVLIFFLFYLFCKFSSILGTKKIVVVVDVVVVNKH